LAVRIGRRFGRKNNKDPDLYAAEALYQLVEIARSPFCQNMTERELIGAIYRELYKYLYADRVVSASRMTVWRHEQEGKHVTGVTGQSDDLTDHRCSETDFLELIEEVCKTTLEKEYLRLKLEGTDEEAISKNLGVCQRVVHSIRATIVKRIKFPDKRKAA
jgi:hypothetical protein